MRLGNLDNYTFLLQFPMIVIFSNLHWHHFQKLCIFHLAYLLGCYVPPSSGYVSPACTCLLTGVLCAATIWLCIVCMHLLTYWAVMCCHHLVMYRLHALAYLLGCYVLPSSGYVSPACTCLLTGLLCAATIWLCIACMHLLTYWGVMCCHHLVMYRLHAVMMLLRVLICVTQHLWAVGYINQSNINSHFTFKYISTSDDVNWLGKIFLPDTKLVMVNIVLLLPIITLSGYINSMCISDMKCTVMTWRSWVQTPIRSNLECVVLLS